MGVKMPSLPNTIPSLVLRSGKYIRRSIGSNSQSRIDHTTLCAPHVATAVPEFRDRRRCTFNDMSVLLASKYFICRLGHNGPINSPQFITCFAATDGIKQRLIDIAQLVGNRITNRNSKRFFKSLQNETAVFRHKEHPGFLREHLSLRDEFVKQILSGQWNDKKLTFKPNFGANGAGVTHMDIRSKQIEFSVFDGNRSVAKYLPAYFKLYPQDFKFNKEGRLIKFTMQRNERSEQHLNFILDLMSIIDCGDQSTSPTGTCSPKFLLDSGMLQYHEDLLKDTKGHVIEGRYRFSFNNYGEFHLEEILNEDFTHGSHLKIGTNGLFVNKGEHGKPWKTMHKFLLNLLDSPIKKVQYDEYMKTLIKSQALHYFTGLKNLGFQASKPGFHGEIDIAWHATDKELVQTANGKTMQVPKPILMEAGFSLWANKEEFQFGLNRPANNSGTTTTLNRGGALIITYTPEGDLVRSNLEETKYVKSVKEAEC